MILPLPLRIILWPFSLLYGLSVRLRAGLYAIGALKQKRLRGKVISVGNLTVGGTGKTPMVIWLAENLLADGKKVAILTRGYRGSQGTSDEVELMKRRLGGRIVFGVGANRYEEGRRIESQQPIDVFLLDDGFQHLSLARDVDILLVDSSRPLRKEWLLPTGRLREPMNATHRADVVVFTRANNQISVKRAIQEFPQFPIFPASTSLIRYGRVGEDQVAALQPIELPLQPVFAFCGIGNPAAFFADIERWGNCIAGRMVFRDHYSYSAPDLRRIEDAALRVRARAILTTEKDAQNLGSGRFSSLPAFYCEIQMKIEDAAQFRATIDRKLAALDRVWS